MKNKKHKKNGMRISFDLDEALFVDPKTHKTEKALKFPLNLVYKERLRLGAPDFVRRLQAEGFEVWVYTSSFRSEDYIKRLFYHYNVRFDNIVNGTRHLKEVQGKRREVFPQKMPTRYQISLHVDDENVIVAAGKKYGFNVYQLCGQDDDWEEKILDKLHEIQRKEKAVRAKEK